MTSDSASVRRLLVLSPNWLGDAVMALPAIADVRRRFPAARLIVAARRSVADLFALVPGVDRGRHARMDGTASAASRAAARQCRAARRSMPTPRSCCRTRLQRRGWCKRAGIARALGLCRRLPPAAADARGRAAARQRASGRVLPASRPRSSGIETGPLEPALTFPTTAIVGARDAARRRAAGTASRPLVVVAPGAAYGTAKRWLPEHFATLVVEARRARGAHVRAGRQPRRCRDDDAGYGAWSPDTQRARRASISRAHDAALAGRA